MRRVDRTPVVIEFHTVNGVRRWRARKVVTGYRLEFRDPDDRKWTNAGTFRTAEAAQEQARKG